MFELIFYSFFGLVLLMLHFEVIPKNNIGLFIAFIISGFVVFYCLPKMFKAIKKGDQ